jgi:NDP-sugar pyrophosphorylase family protein
MGKQRLQAVLLAAGESSRFWPLCEGQHKSLFRLLGKPLIQWTLEALERAGVPEAIIVQSPTRAVEQVLREVNLRMRVHYVVQKSPKGMGDALLAAQREVADSFFLLHAHEFTVDRWIEPMRKKSRQTGAAMILAGQPTQEPWKYGMLDLEGDRVRGIVEKPDSKKTLGEVRAIGIYLLPHEFLEALAGVEEQPYAYEEALGRYMSRHDARVVIRDERTPSLKYPWDLFATTRLLMDAHLHEFRAPTAQISPLAHLEGEVHIGDRVKIYEYAVIKGPCYIGDGCVIGTHALVRDYTDLEEEAMIGAHAEVARCLFQSGSSTHSGYFGDSIFDRGARAGAGTVTANVKVRGDEIRPVVKDRRVPTGLRSLGAMVGAETQLGISVMTMPGVLIGSRSFVGPGTVVEENVPSETRVDLKQQKGLRRMKTHKGRPSAVDKRKGIC